MGNPYYGENSQQLKSEGGGKAAPKGRKPSGSLPYKVGPFPGLPGSATKLRKSVINARRVKQHTQCEGV